MTREEAIAKFEKQLTSAMVVLDSGFGTRPGESDRVYQERKELAEIALSALRQQEHRCPCDLCNFGPPSSMRGKPCTMCPAVPKQETVTERNELTNADRIRAMSDEELCDLLDEWWCMGANNDERLAYADERLAWLQQPAEEDDHENL